MITRITTLATLLFVAVLAGCAHPISLSPDLARVTSATATKIDKKAGLSLADADRSREVTTPGGGGDKVSYFPYRDLEPGIYAAMSQVFSSVTKVTGPADPKVAAEGLSFVITPQVTTTSSSPSAFTWPPTLFTVELNCKVVDAQGAAVSEVKVSGTGKAEFSEFKTDHSLAAKRAADDALAQLVKALSESAALRN